METMTPARDIAATIQTLLDRQVELLAEFHCERSAEVRTTISEVIGELGRDVEQTLARWRSEQVEIKH